MSINKAHTHIGTQPYKVTANIREFVSVFDEPIAEGGANLGPTPMETLSSALGACTAITLRMYAARKQWPLTAVDVDVEIDWRANPPSVLRKINIKGDLSAEQRERLMQIANACPVHKLLENPIHVQTLSGES